MLTLQISPKDSYLKDTIYLSNSVKIKTADKTALLKIFLQTVFKKMSHVYGQPNLRSNENICQEKFPDDLKLSDTIPVFKKKIVRY